MVPQGYELSVYAEDAFKSLIDKIAGGTEEDGDERAICVDFTAGTAHSLRITRAREGKITTYWKPITSSDTLEYEVSVGVTSEDSTSNKDTSTKKLESSLKTGVNISSSYGVPGIGSVSIKAKVEKKTKES